MRDAKKKAAYDMEYARKNLRRVPLNIKHEEYAALKAAAQMAGESVQAYIRNAILERMEKTDGG